MTKRYLILMATQVLLASVHADVLPVCDRTVAVKEFLESTLQKPCAEIQTADLATVKRVAVGNKGISTFKADDFSGLVNLEILNIRSNPYTELPEGLMKDLIHLKTLVIIDTRLRHYPDDYLEFNPEIQNLYTFRNQVRSISESVLGRLEKAQGLKEMEFDDTLQTAEKNRLRALFPEDGVISLIFN